MERRSPGSEQGTSAPPQLRHTRCHPGFGTFFLTRMLHLGPSLPPCPQHEDIILGGWSLVWPQIQACWMDSGVCLQGLGEIPVVRTLLLHMDMAGTRWKCWQAASLGSALATNQASVASKGHNPWERCGEELWGWAVHSPHPLGNFVLCVLWWMLTKEIHHEEGTGAASGSSRAPEREQWDRHKAHRPSAKAKTSNSVVLQMNCRVPVRPWDAANTRDNHLGSGASAGQGYGSPPSSTPAWHQKHSL